MKPKSLILLSTFACAVPIQASLPASTDYTLVTHTTDAGGARSTSAAYTHDGSLGGVAGVSTITTPAETVRHGYLGQLYEVTSLALTSEDTGLDEGATLQLAAWYSLDDDTLLTLSASAVTWSVDNFPLAGIDDNGLATAGAVYENTETTVRATRGEIPDQLTAELDLTVRDTDPDNFGSYAGDGLDDSWQNNYFGLNNPAASPLMDPDADGHDNRFEATAGLVPTDALSRFLLRIETVACEPAQMRVIFSPRWTDRTYDILTSTTLEPDTWSVLTDGVVGDIGNERTVIDLNATGHRKFYRVQITKP